MYKPKRKYIPFIVITAILGGIILILNAAYGGLSFSDDFGEIIYGTLLLLFVGSALAFGNVGEKLKHLLIWAMIFVVALIGYSYRHELSSVKNRVLSELIPGRGATLTLKSASFPVSANGHFYIQADVDGTPVLFLADTGASTIVLSPRDAKRVGFQPQALTFDRFFRTANGTVRGSSVRLSSFSVGTFQLQGVGASVNEAAMGESLLGMTFFEKLERYEVKNDTLTIYWK